MEYKSNILENLQPDYIQLNSNVYADELTGNVSIGEVQSATFTDKFMVKAKAGNGINQIVLQHSGNGVPIVGIGQESSHGSLQLRLNSGATQVRLSATNNNYIIPKLGVGGVTSPNAKLHIAGGSLGMFLSNLGDNSAYDSIKMSYTGYNSGTPEFIFTQTSTPGSGLANTWYRFKNTNGVDGTNPNNVANVTIGGKLGVGTDSPDGKLEVSSNSSLSSYVTQYTNDADGAELVIRTARGTQATPIQYNTGDSAGRLLFQAYTSSGAFKDAASIESVMESGSAYAYGGLRFNYFPGTSPYTLTEGMRLNMDGEVIIPGDVGIGTGVPLAKLQVGLSTSNTGNRSSLAMFGAAESGILNALSLVNTTGAAATGYGTRINFHLSSNYSPTGCIEVVTEDLTSNATDSTMRFSTYGTIGGSTTYQSRLEISSAGAIKFNDYDSTKQTGTPTYLLGTDASGNVVKTNSVPSPITSQADSLYDLIPNGAFTTTYAFTSTAGTYAEVMKGDDVITDTGTYTVQAVVNDFAVGGTQYDVKYSGIMSWHAGSTNDTGQGTESEIVLHRNGHASNQGIIYLRTRETASAEGNELKLEIMCNRTYSAASNVVFKFVRLI